MRYLKQHPFVFFLIVHFFVWSLVPLLRHGLPMDTIEAIVWGQYCDWGTNKHPPLSGYLAYMSYIFGGKAPYALYALSQLCVLLGFVYIYKLAACLFDKKKAMLSAMLLEGVIYYGFSTAEFNVNVVSLALWPMNAYYFYKSLKTGNLLDWTLNGIFAGLNLFNKYVSGVLLLAMALFMLFDKTGREKLKTWKPYWAVLVCVMVIVPHLVWLYQHDFFVIDYFLGRGDKAGFDKMPLLRHVVYPLKFAGSQILFVLGTLLVWFFATYGAEKERESLTKLNRNFLIWLGCVPLMLMILISFIGGIKLKSMWGFPAVYMLGILLWGFFPYKLTETLKRKMVCGIYAIMFLLAVVQSCILIFNKSDKMHMNAPEYGKLIEQIWNQNAKGRPFKYVAGDVWWADNVALYAPSEPKPVIWGDIRKNPWFDAQDFVNSGALLVTAGKGEYMAAVKTLGNTTEPLPLELEFKNHVGKIKRKTIYYGFYNLK